MCAGFPSQSALKQKFALLQPQYFEPYDILYNTEELTVAIMHRGHYVRQYTRPICDTYVFLSCNRDGFYPVATISESNVQNQLHVQYKWSVRAYSDRYILIIVRSCTASQR